MSISSDHSRSVYRKLDKDLEQLSSAPTPQTIHRFRTGVRRLQTLLEEISPRRDRHQKKLLKLLARLRKRAGKVRDLDMQLGALRTLKSAQEPRRKTQLTQALLELRARHERKLRKSLTKREIRDIQKRLKRVLGNGKLQPKHDPVAVARKILSKLVPPANEIRDEQLHAYRKSIKRARYAMEFADGSASSREVMAQLKHLQDALGDWHDWWTLTGNARNRLGDVHQSSLVASMHSVTRSKFRQAVAALAVSPLLKHSLARAADEPRKSAAAESTKQAA